MPKLKWECNEASIRKPEWEEVPRGCALESLGDLLVKELEDRVDPENGVFVVEFSQVANDWRVSVCQQEASNV